MRVDAARLPRLRTASSARLVAVGLALLLISWLVIARSESAFTATTGSSGNELSSGSVLLSDNDGGTALFAVTAMQTGQVETRCIEVTYSGTLAPAAPIRLYGGYVDGPDAGTTADSSLAPYLALSVERGAPGSTCASIGSPTTIFSATVPGASAGKLNTFTTTYSSYGTGLSTGWTPAAASNEMRPFRITMTLDDDNAAQAKTAEPSFTWEARSA